jgi:formate dehydrogenase accessory protein FdhE
VAQSPWRQRIARAETLARQCSFATEILSFYNHVARFQEALYVHLEMSPEAASLHLSPELTQQYQSFLELVEKHGPARLGEVARSLLHWDDSSTWDLLNNLWDRTEVSPSVPEEFLARAFLQPSAMLARARSRANWNGYTHSLCPFCGRKPGAGILRQRGDGGSRSLLCSFCLAEWEFRRIVCAGCGEEDHLKLPVYTASDFDYIRVECCDTCKQYLKTVDLTKNGLADPVVDEIAAAPLDLWAREQGYAKLEPNLVGM